MLDIQDNNDNARMPKEVSEKDDKIERWWN